MQPRSLLYLKKLLIIGVAIIVSPLAFLVLLAFAGAYYDRAIGEGTNWRILVMYGFVAVLVAITYYFLYKKWRSLD